MVKTREGSIRCIIIIISLTILVSIETLGPLNQTFSCRREVGDGEVGVGIRTSVRMGVG